MKLVGYVRLSKETDKSVSLAAQRERIETYTRLYDLDLADIIVDNDESGKSLNRPGLQRALSMLENGDVGGLIVSKLDRLTRSVRDLGVLLDDYFANGYSLVSVSEHFDTHTPHGRLILHILISVSQWERETISRRTRDALDYKRNRGERISGYIPYGKRLASDGIHLEDEPNEQRVIATIRRYRKNGLTIRAIVERLKKRGVTSRMGRPLGVAQVHAIVKDTNE